mmetsp:Transcript_3564/g.12579  ORF Transcript_3564/g.12579 Transcript_3564/m.12579 type:complete len:405 (+) Transcript_3564:834-2048(+)
MPRLQLPRCLRRHCPSYRATTRGRCRGRKRGRGWGTGVGGELLEEDGELCLVRVEDLWLAVRVFNDLHQVEVQLMLAAKSLHHCGKVHPHSAAGAVEAADDLEPSAGGSGGANGHSFSLSRGLSDDKEWGRLSRLNGELERSTEAGVEGAGEAFHRAVAHRVCPVPRRIGKELLHGHCRKASVGEDREGAVAEECGSAVCQAVEAALLSVEKAAASDAREEGMEETAREPPPLPRYLRLMLWTDESDVAERLPRQLLQGHCAEEAALHGADAGEVGDEHAGVLVAADRRACLAADGALELEGPLVSCSQAVELSSKSDRDARGQACALHVSKVPALTEREKGAHCQPLPHVCSLLLRHLVARGTETAGAGVVGGRSGGVDNVIQTVAAIRAAPDDGNLLARGRR